MKMIKMNFITGFKKSDFSSSNKFFTSMVIGLMLTVLAGVASSQSDSILADNFPERYVVVKGDTLWDISGRFLRDPWRWPEIWQGNSQVENPDLIYPGDVLVLTFIDGKPVLRKLGRDTIKLSPTARSEDLNAIPTIDPGSIQAYLTAPLVTDESELDKAPYIVDGFDDRLLLGEYSKFYARGFVRVDEEGNEVRTPIVDKYSVFRTGRKFTDPVTGEHLGWEAVDLGKALFQKNGDPARLVVDKSNQDITVKDRLRPIFNEDPIPYFHPHPPLNSAVKGYILDTPNRATELGALSIIAINLGRRNSIDPGTVLQINSQSRAKVDPVTNEAYVIPEEPVGLAMVFRVFDKISYAIVTNSERQVLPGDVLVSPNAN